MSDHIQVMSQSALLTIPGALIVAVQCIRKWYGNLMKVMRENYEQVL